MRITEVLTIASLFLLPGAIARAYAEAPHGEEKQPAQQQARPAQQQAKPAQQQAKPAQQQAKPAQQQAKPAQQQQRAQQQAKPAQQQRAQQQAKPAQQQAKRAEPAHGRIPDDRFRASFGRGHTFHVNRSDFAGSSRRFQYGGFWFAMVNPWPVAWLYTDDVYVDYINGGYFLCDPIHPGVYLSITVG
jgi:hypothetical protein